MNPRPDGPSRGPSARALEDFYDETPPEVFFLAPEARIMDCQEELSTLLKADEGVAVVLHLARECTSHYAWLDSTFYYRHMYPRVVQLPMTGARRNLHFIETSNLDAMLGREGDLRQAIRRVLAAAGVKLVVLVSSCVAEVTGLPVRSILEEEAGQADLPTVFLDLTIDENTPMQEFWAGVFQLAKPEPNPDPRAINLIGYRTAGSIFSLEVSQVLARAGGRLNTVLIPSLDSAAVERFGQAATTVVNTARAVEQEFSSARRALWQMRYLDLPPPFGPAASRAFYRQLIAALPDGAGSDLPEQIWDDLRAAWDAHARIASGHRVAIVVGPEQAGLLFDPDRLYGLDLIPALCEMGFGVDILCCAPDQGPSSADFAASLAAELRMLTRADPAVCVQPVPGSRALAPLLAGLEASLVFSEFPGDRRVLDAGKMAVHPRDFELGFAGAVRTIARLTRLAECGFAGGWGRGADLGTGG